MGLLGEEREGRKGSCFLVVELQVFGGQWAALNTRSGENRVGDLRSIRTHVVLHTLSSPKERRGRVLGNAKRQVQEEAAGGWKGSRGAGR